eukprot:gene1581-963_t
MQLFNSSCIKFLVTFILVRTESQFFIYSFYQFPPYLCVNGLLPGLFGVEIFSSSRITPVSAHQLVSLNYSPDADCLPSVLLFELQSKPLSKALNTLRNISPLIVPHLYPSAPADASVSFSTGFKVNRFLQPSQLMILLWKHSSFLNQPHGFDSLTILLQMNRQERKRKHNRHFVLFSLISLSSVFSEGHTSWTHREMKSNFYPVQQVRPAQVT